jgi:hypothetical protein
LALIDFPLVGIVVGKKDCSYSFSSDGGIWVENVFTRFLFLIVPRIPINKEIRLVVAVEFQYKPALPDRKDRYMFLDNVEH